MPSSDPGVGPGSEGLRDAGLSDGEIDVPSDYFPRLAGLEVK